MAERGRKPKGNYKQKTEVFSTRIRADTKAALVASAKERGHSLSQEIELRLCRSLAGDDSVINRFESRKNFAILRTIAGIMGLYHSPDGSAWIDDAFAFERTMQTIIRVLEALRPSGEVQPPEGTKDWISP